MHICIILPEQNTFSDKNDVIRSWKAMNSNLAEPKKNTGKDLIMINFSHQTCSYLVGQLREIIVCFVIKPPYSQEVYVSI